MPDTQLPGELVDHLAKRQQQRNAAVVQTLEALTPRERHIVREAAVMGYVHGVRAGSGAIIPPDSHIVAGVVDGCRSMPDLYPVLGGQPATVTLRDLIRAGRAIGAPLRRSTSTGGGMSEYWQCWDEGARRRRVMVRRWPGTGTWRVEIYGTGDTLAVDHAVRVDMQNPTITEIAAAARLCGWDIGGES